MSSQTLTLTYQINLAGNLQKQAADIAKSIEKLGDQQAKSMEAAGKELGANERKIQQYGRTLQDAERQNQTAFARTAEAARSTGNAIEQIAQHGTFSRMLGYMTTVERKLNDIRRTAARVELGQVGGTIRSIGSGIGSVQMAGKAGIAAASAFLAKPMEFDQQMRFLTNSANGDASIVARDAAKKELEQHINDAAVKNATSREATAAAYGRLVGSSQLSKEEMNAMLPEIMKTAAASGASPESLADTAVAMKRMGIKPEQMGLAFSQAMKAGFIGGVELPDFAKDLPDTLKKASMRGYSGLKGFGQMLAYVQAGSKVATSSSENAGNIQSLMDTMTKPTTRASFARAKVDLAGSMARAQRNGVDSIQAFGEAAMRVIAKDKHSKQIAQLLKTAAAQKGDEQAGTLEQVQQLAESGAAAEIVRNPGALMAMMAIQNNTDLIKQIKQETGKETGASRETAFEFISDSMDFKARQTAINAEIAKSNASYSAMPMIGGLLNQVNRLAQEYPQITTAMTGISGAAGVINAVVAPLLLKKFLLGGGGAAGGAAGAGGNAAAAGAVGGFMSALGAASGVGLIATLMNMNDKGEEKLIDNLRQREKATTKRMEATFTPDEIAAARRSKPWYEFAEPKPDILWERANAERVKHGGTAVPLNVPSPADLPSQRAAAGFAPLAFSSPASLPVPMLPNQKPEPQHVEVGEGQVNINIHLTDERTSVNTFVGKQPDLFKINMGATNPAGGG